MRKQTSICPCFEGWSEAKCLRQNSAAFWSCRVKLFEVRNSCDYFFFVAGCFKHVIFCHCTHCATAPIIGHSALKWALVTPAEEVMSIFYKDAAQNCAQVSNEAPKGVRSQVMFSWHLFIHVICCEPIDCSIAPKDHEDGNGNDDGNGQGL